MSFNSFNSFAPFGGVPAFFSPLSLSPALWLSDAGTDPSVWPDLSGNGRHAAQADTSQQLAIISSGMNGRQVRRSTGNPCGMATPSFAHSGMYTIFLVASLADGSGDRLPYEFGVDYTVMGAFFLNLLGNGGISQFSTGGELSTSAYSDKSLTSKQLVGSAKVIGHRSTGANAGHQLRINGAIPALTTVRVGDIGTNTVSPQSFNVARRSTGLYAAGDYAEILLFLNTLSDAECTKVESYLGAKWGISVA